MGIERVLRIAITVTTLAIAAPFVAPSLLTYTVMQQDLRSMEDDKPAPSPAAVAKPQPPAPLVSDGPRGSTVTLRADPHGSFLANPIINGHAVKAVIDTGATTVAISSDTARRLGVQPSRGNSVMVSTANGVTSAATVKLREIKVGEIVVRDVDAVVIDGYGLDTTLLGMSFLKRLQKFEISGGKLVLTQ
jgi:aspartyl protease family protein